MTRLNSVFRDEIKMHLSVREAELSHEAYRHYRRTTVSYTHLDVYKRQYWIRSTFAGMIRSSSRTTFFPMTSIGVLQ